VIESSKVPKRAVIGLILNEKRDEVLLIKRRDVPIWVLPGGGVESWETPEEAVLREVEEETGLQIKIKRLVALYSPINRLACDTYLFECHEVAGQLTAGEETLQTGFFSLESLPEPFFFLHQEWIEDAKKNLPHIIKRPLTDVTYVKLFKYFCRHPLQVLRILFSRLGYPMNSKIK